MTLIGERSLSMSFLVCVVCTYVYTLTFTDRQGEVVLLYICVHTDTVCVCMYVCMYICMYMYNVLRWFRFLT